MIPKESISARIKTAMEIRNLKQVDLVEKTGLSKSGISQYISGRNLPKQKAIYLLSQALHVEEAWLMGYDVPMEPSRLPSGARPINDISRIPLLGHVACGQPLYDDGNIIGDVYVDPELAASGNLFALRSTGRSMEPRINEGDTLIIREQPDADDGDVVIVTINGDEGTCKKLRKYPDHIVLLPLNQTYEPLYYNNDEIDQLPVRIIGKVVQVRHDF